MTTPFQPPPDINLRWTRADIGSIIPSQTETAVESVRQAFEVLRSFLSTVTSYIQLIRALSADSLSLYRALIQLAIEGLEALIAIFTDTSASMMYYIPPSVRAIPSPQQALQMISSSFFDRGDSNRPVALNRGTAFANLTFFVSSANLSELLRQVEALVELFTRPIPRIPRREARRDMFAGIGGWPPSGRSGGGMTPDWLETQRLADVPIFGEFVQSILSIRDVLVVQDGNLARLQQQADLINARISQILLRIQAVERTLEAIIEAALVLSGSQVLCVYGTGNTVDQSTAIRSASGHPEFPFNRGLAGCGFLTLHFQAGSLGTIIGLLNVLTSGGVDVNALNITRPREALVALGRAPADPNTVVTNPWGRR